MLYFLFTDILFLFFRSEVHARYAKRRKFLRNDTSISSIIFSIRLSVGDYICECVVFLNVFRGQNFHICWFSKWCSVYHAIILWSFYWTFYYNVTHWQLFKHMCEKILYNIFDFGGKYQSVAKTVRYIVNYFSFVVCVFIIIYSYHNECVLNVSELIKIFRSVKIWWNLGISGLLKFIVEGKHIL